MVETANTPAPSSLLSAQTINLQPVLQGERLLLRPLQPDDFEPLYAVASDPLIWEQHPDPTRYQREVFAGFFEKALESKGALIVINKANSQVIGTSRYYEWNPVQREIAIGYTFLARKHWGGVSNGEMKGLMLQHISQWATSVWFHIGANNLRSRKAVEKLGGELSHMAPMQVNGVAVPYAYYKLVPTASLMGKN